MTKAKPKPKAKPGTYLEVWSGRDGQWYFHAVSRNGQVGDVSEGYTRKSDALRGAARWHPGVPYELIDGDC